MVGLAFLLREYFVLATVVDQPIRGDVREYVFYAWNLHYHGVFGMTPPDAAVPVPDAYRSPGYPWLLALCMGLRPSGWGWYALALQLQVVLGTLTVWLTMVVGRQWMPRGWALGAGALLAVWPHHIAATGTLLSEILFGFLLMAGLAAIGWSLGSKSNKVAGASAAGAAFAAAYLVNPVIALFPALAAWLLWRRAGRASAVAFSVLFLTAVAGLAIRNASLHTQAHPQPGRAAINFVEGSWPQYHDAWMSQAKGDPIGRSIMAAIDDETRLLDSHPVEGIRAIGSRIASDPSYFGAWYLRKPLLLWDWEIRVGRGGVYFLPVRQSPLETNPALRAAGHLLKTLNPAISLVALAAMLGLTWRWRKAGSAMHAAGLATVVLGLYLTLVHTAFQAEPRYANAYRGIELLALVAGIGTVCTALQGIRHRK